MYVWIFLKIFIIKVVWKENVFNLKSLESLWKKYNNEICDYNFQGFHIIDWEILKNVNDNENGTFFLLKGN